MSKNSKKSVDVGDFQEACLHLHECKLGLRFPSLKDISWLQVIGISHVTHCEKLQRKKGNLRLAVRSWLQVIGISHVTRCEKLQRKKGISD